MVDVQRTDMPQYCLECGGEGEMIFVTINASFSICDCGILCIRIDRPTEDATQEGPILASYFHWYQPLAITAEPEEEENP